MKISLILMVHQFNISDIMGGHWSMTIDLLVIILLLGAKHHHQWKSEQSQTELQQWDSSPNSRFYLIFFWVSIGRHWLAHSGNGSVYGGPSWYLLVPGQYGAVQVGSWWYGSVWGSNGWYLVVLGQYNLVLFGMKWYWVIIGLLCLYILKKIMVTSTNRRPTRWI